MQYLYLIECQNLYKIGVANDAFHRLVALQTGNPFPLRLVECFEFDHAEIVERVLHQKFASYRKRGEWFDLSQGSLTQFSELCILLNGIPVEIRNQADEADVAIAEEEQESENKGAHWDFESMFADGWRMETNNGGRNWRWRRGSAGNREVLAGGRVDDLPYSIEEMRIKFDETSP